MDIEHAERFAKAEERLDEHDRRFDEMEKRQDNLDKIAGAVEALAVREENVESAVNEIKTDVKSLTSKSGNRWDNLVDKIVWAVAAAIIAFILSRLGLG